MEIAIAGAACIGLGWITLTAGYLIVRNEYEEYMKSHGYMNVNDYYLYVDVSFGKWFWYIRYFPNGNPQKVRTVAASANEYNTHKEALDAGFTELERYANE